MGKKKLPKLCRKPIHENMSNDNLTYDEIDKLEELASPSKEIIDEIDSNEEQDPLNQPGELEESTKDLDKPNVFRARSVSPIQIIRKESEIAYKRANVKQKNDSFEKDNSKTKLLSPQKDNQIIASETTYNIIAAIIIIVSVIAVGFAAAKGYSIYVSDEKIRKSHEKSPTENPKICDFGSLSTKYPSEENSLWILLKYGIEEIINIENPEGPSVYLFLRDSNSTATNFIDEISSHTASCFDHDLQPIALEKNDFDSDDYGVAIVKYKQKIHDGGVLVVSANLNEVPGKAARALHSICDKHSPIVKKVVIFLSLLIEPDLKGLPTYIAEQTLHKHWKSSLASYELDALIVRVCDTVIRLKS